MEKASKGRGRIAWVTGASSGIGEATALELARQGWRVAISARQEAPLQALAERASGQVLVVPCDITDRGSLDAALAQIDQAWGPVDLALLNAGTYTKDGLTDFDIDSFSTQVEVNIKGTAQCIDAVRGSMMARRSGQIVLVSSVAGYRGLPGSLAYGATKAALINMAECLWIEARPYNIKVQCVCPGFVKTPLTDKNAFPMPMRMEVEPAAQALVRGLDRNSFEIRFPWLFTFIMNRLRGLNNRLYLSLVASGLGFKKGSAPPRETQQAPTE